MEDVVTASPPAPPTPVALVGAVASVEEAMLMHQMRFILMWSMRMQCITPKPEREAPLDLVHLLAPSLVTGPPSDEGM